jgi:hypothetical protein
VDIRVTEIWSVPETSPPVAVDTHEQRLVSCTVGLGIPQLGVTDDVTFSISSGVVSPAWHQAIP